jgi:hypothetical protein
MCFIKIVTLLIVFFFSTSIYAYPEIDISVVRPVNNNIILSNTNPIPGVISKSLINITACRGEYEPASIVMRSPVKDISSISVEITNLKNANDSISSSNIDLKIVKVWYQGGGAWESRNYYKYKPRKLVPELLLNDENLVKVDFKRKKNYLHVIEGGKFKYIDISSSEYKKGELLHSILDFNVQDNSFLQPFNLNKGDNKQLWITIKVPENKKEGLYEGSLKFKSRDGGVLKEIKIHVNVLPFDLVKPKMIYSIYYRGQLKPDKPTISSEYKSKEQLIAELTNMQEHGISHPTMYQSLIDIPMLNMHLSIRDKLSLNNGTLYYLGIMTYPHKYKTYPKLKNMVKTIKHASKNHNLDTIYVYGIDEAVEERLMQQKKAWDVVHEEGVKLFVAGYKDTLKHVGKSLDTLIFAGKPNEIEIKLAHKNGNKILSYNNPQSGPENPLVFRKNYGIVLWQNEYDGAMPYAYQHSFGSAWNDMDHERFRDHMFAYPTSIGVIDTIAWEGFREGVDDVRYINTLEEYISKVKRNPKISGRRADTADIAEKYLQILKNNEVTNLDSMRLVIVNFILKLKDTIDNTSKVIPYDKN